MAVYTLRGLFKAIADIIRKKKGTNKPIPATEFPERIISINRDLFAEIVTGVVTNIKAYEIEDAIIIGAGAFAGCVNLETVYLPDTIEMIDDSAFLNCIKLKYIDLSNVSEIRNLAFHKCTSLESIDLPKSIEFIDNNAFSNCDNLKTINVAWSEGEIENAPWGANNAVINYNYGGE